MKRFLMMMTLIGLVGNWNSTLTAQLVSPDSLYLNEDLPEINIVAVKPLIKAEADKTTYSIAEDPDSRTYTLLEMLRKVPLVTVDGEDNVKVNGQSSFKIYMNGRPSNMFSNNPKEVLRSATLKYGRLSLSGNYTFSQQSSESESDYLRTQSEDGAKLRMLSDVDVKYPAHYGSLEGSFEIDTLNLISLSGNLNIGNSNSIWNSHYSRLDKEGEEIYAYNEDMSKKNEWGSASLKADYQRLFKRNKEEMLTLSYQYDYIPNDIYSVFYDKDKMGNVSLPQLEADYTRQISHARTHEHTAQLDYVNPFTSTHSIEGGLKLIRRSSTSHATSEVKELDEGVWLPADLQPLVEYRHVQNICSAYAGYGFKYGKWSLNPGIRMEHTWQDVTYKQGEGKDFNYRVTDWVPSWTSAFRLDDRSLFRLAYNLRLRRPNISYLNPTVFVSGTSISYGNPGLVSEKHHRLSASYSYYGTKLNVQASVLCTLGKGVIDEYLFIDSANVVNSTYDNLVDVKAAGGNLYLSYNPSPRTSVSLNSMLHYLDLRAQEGNEVYDTDVRNSGFCGSAFVDFSQKFKYGWRFVLSGGYVRSEPNVGMDSYGFYFYGLSVVKSFLKDKLTCTLRAQDFLGDHKTIQINERYPDFHIRQTERMFSRGFGIAISYRIGDLKASVKKAGRSIRNDDLLDALDK